MVNTGVDGIVWEEVIPTTSGETAPVPIPAARFALTTPASDIEALAAACFAKSSQRFYDWIINNKLFGHHVKNYREGNGIPKKSKPIILTTLWGFVLFAVLVAIPDSAPPISRYATLILAVIGTIFILRIPSLEE